MMTSEPIYLATATGLYRYEPGTDYVGRLEADDTFHVVPQVYVHSALDFEIWVRLQS